MAAFSNYMEDHITAWINDEKMYRWNEDILNWEEINLTQ